MIKLRLKLYVGLLPSLNLTIVNAQKVLVITITFSLQKTFVTKIKTILQNRVIWTSLCVKIMYLYSVCIGCMPAAYFKKKFTCNLCNFLNVKEGSLWKGHLTLYCDLIFPFLSPLIKGRIKVLRAIPFKNRREMNVILLGFLWLHRSCVLCTVPGRDLCSTEITLQS